MKKLFFILATIVTILIISGCKSDPQPCTYIFYDTEIIGIGREGYEDKIAMDLEIRDVISTMDNCYTDMVDRVIKDVDAIIAKYNNALLYGTAYLWCSIPINGSQTLKVWTLTAESKK